LRTNSRRKLKKNNHYDTLNKHATLLIERSIHKNRYQLTPSRTIPLESKLDLSEAILKRPRNKIKLKQQHYVVAKTRY
jgi:hypothetical protein